MKEFRYLIFILSIGAVFAEISVARAKNTYTPSNLTTEATVVVSISENGQKIGCSAISKKEAHPQLVVTSFKDGNGTISFTTDGYKLKDPGVSKIALSIEGSALEKPVIVAKRIGTINVTKAEMRRAEKALRIGGKNIDSVAYAEMHMLVEKCVKE